MVIKKNDSSQNFAIIYVKTLFVFVLLSLFPFYLNCAEFSKLLVIKKIPHDVKAFTQGLAFYNDQLYESTGLYHFSTLRLIDIENGQIQKIRHLPPHLFAEGIAIFDNRLIQLTWKEKNAIIYDRESFQPINQLTYTGEGWGLCRDEQTLWMSNGSPILTQRNAENFEILKELTVTINHYPVHLINDLECVDQWIYANILRKDFIAKIDKKTGEVVALFDASQLLSFDEKKELTIESVLNGIAYRPSTQTFFLTGKNWPWMFEVQFK